jgi:hypothetical protein
LRIYPVEDNTNSTKTIAGLKSLFAKWSGVKTGKALCSAP